MLAGEAARVQKAFKVADKAFWHCKVGALAGSGQWEALRRFATKEKSGKSPIGYRPFALAVMRAGRPAGEIREYIEKIGEPEQRFGLLLDVALWRDAAEVAFRLKDARRLAEVRTVEVVRCLVVPDCSDCASWQRARHAVADEAPDARRAPSRKERRTALVGRNASGALSLEPFRDTPSPLGGGCRMARCLIVPRALLARASLARVAQVKYKAGSQGAPDAAEIGALVDERLARLGVK